MLNPFEELKKELEAVRLQKAESDKEPEPKDEGEGEDNDVIEFDDDEGKEPLKKSFTDEHGKTVEAVDGTELIKGMTARLDAQDTQFTQLAALLRESTDLIKSQSAEIAELRSTIKEFGNQGRGRKSVLTVHDKPGALHKSEPEGISANDFMAKAETAFKAGKITGMEISIAESAINHGEQIPDRIAHKVLN